MVGRVRFAISPGKQKELDARLDALGIAAGDVEERFCRSRGPGGQNVNKVSTGVRLRHKPTGIETQAQESRSQSLNRFVALRRLCDRIARERDGIATAEDLKKAKRRKQKHRRARRASRKHDPGE